MNYEGFTLVEIMIVVVIIALLAGIAVPQFLANMQVAKISRANSELDSLNKAIDMYETHCSQWPPDLSALLSAPAACPEPQWKGPYYPPVLTDPWRHVYSYGVPGGVKTATYVWSWGPNGVNDICVDGSDDVCLDIQG